MFLRHRDRAALREEKERRQRDLAQMQEILAGYRAQERDLLQVLVEAQEAGRRRRAEAESQARDIVERARTEADGLLAAAHAERSSVEADIERLRRVRQDLGRSLGATLAALEAAIPPIEDAAAAVPRAESSARPSRPEGAAPVAGPVQPAADTPQDGSAAEAATPQIDGPPALTPPRRPQGFSMTAALLILLAPAGVIGALTWWQSAARSLSSSPVDVSAGREAVPEPPASGAAGAAADVPAVAAGPRTAPVLDTPATPAEGVSVALRTIRPVWIRAQVDGRTRLERTVASEEQAVFHGEGEIVLRVGDAGAVLVAIDGGEFAALGRHGAVLTRRIGPGGGEAAAPGDGRPSAPAAAAAVLPASPTGTAALEAIAAPAPAAVTDALGRTSAPAPAASTVVEAPAVAVAEDSPTAIGHPEEREILRAHRAYFEALVQGNEAEIGRWTDESFVMTGTPPLTVGQAGAPITVSMTDISVQVSGVGAVVSGRITQSIVTPDERIAREQSWLFSEVWIKADGRWRLLNVRFAEAPGPN